MINKNSGRARDLLLVHGVLYTVLWAMALYYTIFARPDLLLWGQNRILPALLWTPLIIIHIALYFRAHPTETVTADEGNSAYRAGYRDGFRDGIEGTHSSHEDAHLALGEDGELIDWEAEGKRKRVER